MNDVCTHHWMVSEPTVKFTFTGSRSKLDMTEFTHQVCKKCGETRTNACEVPPEYRDWHEHDPSMGRRKDHAWVM